MVKAIFFDVDGTLVPIGEYHMIESACKAIKLLQEKGIKCIVCSGRDYREIGRDNNVLDKVKFDGTIALTGQYCMDGNGVPFYVQAFDDKQAKEVAALFNEKEYAMCLKTEKGSYINFIGEINGEIYKRLKKEVWHIGEYTNEKIYQAMVYIKQEDVYKLKERLDSLDITSWHPLMTDIIPLGGGKAKGIKKYLEKENIKLEDTMAFGDSDNDLDMLKFVNIGVAMGNSNDRLKQEANYVTDSCKNDGVYKALKHFELI